MTQRRYLHLLLIPILLLAAYLRLKELNSDALSTDGAAITLKALDVLAGDFTLRGTVMSVGLWHSPLSIYFYAIPYAFVPDPRAAVAFTALMNIAAVALVYVIGARYLSLSAGLFASLLYALHPEAVNASLGIWNPDLGAPFVMAYLLTGLWGYADATPSRLARWLHPLFLSLTMQCHPTAVLLAPISAVLWLNRLRQPAAPRRQLILDAALSAVIAALSLLPWLIGTLPGLLTPTTAQDSFDPGGHRGLGYLASELFILIANWQPHPTQWLQVGLTLVATLWFTVRALFTLRDSDKFTAALPGLVAVLGFWLVPVLGLVLDVKFRQYHLWQTYGSAFLIQGAFLAALFDPALAALRQAPRPVSSVTARPLLMSVGVLALVGWLAVTHVTFAHTYDRSAGRPTTADMLTAADLAAQSAAQANQPLLLLAPPGADLPWEVLARLTHTRVIQPGAPLPLPPSGATVLASVDSDLSPPFVGPVTPLTHGYQLATLAPAADYRATAPALAPIAFSADLTAEGYLFAAPPQPGQPWAVYLRWSSATPPPADLKFSTQLEDAAGNRYAQADPPALPPGNWRADEVYLTRFDLAPAADLPPTGPLYLRLSPYTTAGPLADSVRLQVRGAPQPVFTWPDLGLALDEVNISAELPQGPPLNITASWQATADLPALDLSYTVTTAAGDAVFTAVLPLAARQPIPANAFHLQTDTLRLPTDLPPSDYILTLQPGDSSFAYAHNFIVTPRARAFEPPPLTAAPTVFQSPDGTLTFLGYNSALTDRQLSIQLVWQVEQPPMADLAYFFHVRTAADETVAQADGFPGSYDYPTSWWAPGEVVTTNLTLDLAAFPAGDYTLVLGLYDPFTSARLTTSTAADQFHLAPLTLP